MTDAVRCVLRQRRKRFANVLRTLRGEQPEAPQAPEPQTREPVGDTEAFGGSDFEDTDPATWVIDADEALRIAYRELSAVRRGLAIDAQGAPLYSYVWDGLRAVDAALSDLETILRHKT